MYEVTSPKKNDTKISNFGSVVCFPGEKFCETVSSSNLSFPFQPELDANECHFGLPQQRAVIHSTLSMRIVHERVSSVRNAH